MNSNDDNATRTKVRSVHDNPFALVKTIFWVGYWVYHGGWPVGKVVVAKLMDRITRSCADLFSGKKSGASSFLFYAGIGVFLVSAAVRYLPSMH